MSDRPAVLVAGGTGALGSAVVRALIDDGRAVTSTWVVESERERLESDVPAAALVEADLLDPAGAEAAVAAVEDLGAVVNLVGGFAMGERVHEMEPDAWERMLALNLRPGFLLARAAMPRLVERGGGTWVGVGARAALQPFAAAAAYVTAKAAVIAFTKALDADYRGDGVRCNCVLPSVIDTPANRAAQPDADHTRWVRPDEIAGVIRFLASSASSPTSGAAIPVYGRA